MLKAIIVDDEEHCRNRLVHLLANYENKIILVAVCSTLTEAKEQIESKTPDIVFLDVHLNDETGFDLLKQLTKINFEVIFTTAYDTYAVEAFRFSALDYLLKPLDVDEFATTIQKLVEKTDQKEIAKKLETLFHNFEHKFNGTKKLAIPRLYGHSFVKVDDIVRCQSDGNYTDIYLNSNRKITATRTLKYFEELLNAPQFFRAHKSHYINMDYVDKYVKGKGSYVQMADGASVEIATRRREEFLKKMNS
ncbi:LytR/AlgR family response regulator transcription factor [Maribacter sp. 2210JD10-5]|uniref:LytR/AlgR family response regulator transcription factor n=1 Tax=Maribacter sp. 2210JD10-5 TaxID=3386272 RepID=UPI0039BD5CB2